MREKAELHRIGILLILKKQTDYVTIAHQDDKYAPEVCRESVSVYS